MRPLRSLEKEGISARVVNVSTLKPLDENAIIDLAKDMKGVVTAEEHSYIGGLASAVSCTEKHPGTIRGSGDKRRIRTVG